MEPEVEDFIMRVIYPVFHRYELDVEYAKRNKESFKREEVAGFLKLGLMRTMEELTSALLKEGMPKELAAPIVKDFANAGRDLAKRNGLPEVKLESFVMTFAVAKPTDPKEKAGQNVR